MQNNSNRKISKAVQRRRNVKRRRGLDDSIDMENPTGKRLLEIYNSHNLVFKPSAVFPALLHTTLTYRQQTNFSAVTTPQLYVFRGNGAFDPDQTGVGSQPVGFDNLSTFYTSYFCRGSRIEIDIINNGLAPLQLAISPATTASTVGTYDNALLYPITKYICADGTGRGGASHKKISMQMASTQIFSKPYDDDFECAVTTTPTSQWYWEINMQSSDQATAISAVLQISISYDTFFSGRKFVALS